MFTNLVNLNFHLYLLSGLSLILIFLLILYGVRLAETRRQMKQVIQALESYLTSNDSRLTQFQWKFKPENLLKRIFQLVVNLVEQKNSLESYLLKLNQEQEYKSKYLDTAQQITQLSSKTKEIGQFLKSLSSIIADQLKLSHAGIFLIDDVGDYAVLRASDSEGGKKLLLRGFKVKVGHEGIVGLVADTGRDHIAEDVSEDFWYSNIPELPRTRSELAVPIVLSGKTIGVIDVHANQPSGFDKDSLTFFQLLAGQISSFIFAFNTYQQYQQTQSKISNFISQQSFEGWRQKLDEKEFSYHFDRMGVEPYDDRAITLNQSQKIPGHQIEVPITYQGVNYGSIILWREPHLPEWTGDDLALAVEAVAQFTPSLENARLMEEIKQQRQLENRVSHINAQLQTSTSLETVMRTTVQEIGNAISASSIRFRLLELEIDEYPEYSATGDNIHAE